MNSIEIERSPSKTWVDRGQVFYNKDVQKLVELYSTENEENSCVIGRFNSTIKEIFLIISLLAEKYKETMLMYLTYLWISTLIRFIQR